MLRNILWLSDFKQIDRIVLLDYVVGFHLELAFLEMDCLKICATNIR